MESEIKKKKIKENCIIGIAVLALILSIGQMGWLIYSNRDTTKQLFPATEDDAKIKAIETYLDTISPEFIASVQTLVAENNAPSWGCGPSSYALAKILNKKFFNDKLPIEAAYHNKSHAIVERFSFAFKQPSDIKSSQGVDHAWLELYFDNQFMYIDPTIGQFGNYHRIVYEVFKVGDPAVSTTLLEKYGIADMRLKLLVQKVVNRVPISQEPYPGITLDPKMIDYYLQSVQERDTVDNGEQPKEWEPWVHTLLADFS